MAAQVNTIGKFKPVFDRMLENLLIDRTEGNGEIRNRVMNDEEFRNAVAAHLMRDVYSSPRRKKTAHILPTDHLTW
jgi:type I restriction enzyme R subunit